jgi:hypothetical protein
MIKSYRAISPAFKKHCWVAAILLIVDDRLSRALAQFKLRTHLLDLRCLLFHNRNESFDFFLSLDFRRLLILRSGFEPRDHRFLFCYSRFEFLHCAVFFQKFVE